jgi:hypothetical protein
LKVPSPRKSFNKVDFFDNLSRGARVLVGVFALVQIQNWVSPASLSGWNLGSAIGSATFLLTFASLLGALGAGLMIRSDSPVARILPRWDRIVWVYLAGCVAVSITSLVVGLENLGSYRRSQPLLKGCHYLLTQKTGPSLCVSKERWISVGAHNLGMLVGVGSIVTTVSLIIIGTLTQRGATA